LPLEVHDVLNGLDYVGYDTSQLDPLEIYTYLTDYFFSGCMSYDEYWYNYDYNYDYTTDSDYDYTTDSNYDYTTDSDYDYTTDSDYDYSEEYYYDYSYDYNYDYTSGEYYHDSYYYGCYYNSVVIDLTWLEEMFTHFGIDWTTFDQTAYEEVLFDLSIQQMPYDVTMILHYLDYVGYDWTQVDQG
jgi:hypothetical protein